MVIILLNDKSVKYRGMYRTLSEPYPEYETTDKYCWTWSVVSKNSGLMHPSSQVNILSRFRSFKYDFISNIPCNLKNHLKESLT